MILDLTAQGRKVQNLSPALGHFFTYDLLRLVIDYLVLLQCILRVYLVHVSELEFLPALCLLRV